MFGIGVFKSSKKPPNDNPPLVGQKPSVETKGDLGDPRASTTVRASQRPSAVQLGDR
jgi:hypothetical protein